MIRPVSLLLVYIVTIIILNYLYIFTERFISPWNDPNVKDPMGDVAQANALTLRQAILKSNTQLFPINYKTSGFQSLIGENRSLKEKLKAASLQILTNITLPFKSFNFQITSDPYDIYVDNTNTAMYNYVFTVNVVNTTDLSANAVSFYVTDNGNNVKPLAAHMPPNTPFSFRSFNSQGPVDNYYTIYNKLHLMDPFLTSGRK